MVSMKNCVRIYTLICLLLPYYSTSYSCMFVENSTVFPEAKQFAATCSNLIYSYHKKERLFSKLGKVFPATSILYQTSKFIHSSTDHALYATLILLLIIMMVTICMTVQHVCTSKSVIISTDCAHYTCYIDFWIFC